MNVCAHLACMCAARRDARLEYALLLYLNKQYDDAWLELGILQERQQQQQQQQQEQAACGGEWGRVQEEDRVAILQEKIRLMLCAA